MVVELDPGSHHVVLREIPLREGLYERRLSYALVAWRGTELVSRLPPVLEREQDGLSVCLSVCRTNDDDLAP